MLFQYNAFLFLEEKFNGEKDQFHHLRFTLIGGLILRLDLKVLSPKLPVGQ